MSAPQEPHANPHISVVVAAYNEEDTIGAVLDALGELDLDMEVIVVNDGSTDRTAAIIESRTGPRLQLISKPNGGKGTALRAGFEAASGSIIVIQDADVELSPARIPDLIAPILAGDADVVLVPDSSNPCQDSAGNVALQTGSSRCFRISRSTRN